MIQKSILLTIPVFRRFELTEIMLRQLRVTFDKLKEHKVLASAVIIGDDVNLDMAEILGFPTISAPNKLGSKYNDGHQYATENGWDISVQANSDQAFTPEFFIELAQSPMDKVIYSKWLTVVDGKRAITFKRDEDHWALTAYPTTLLEANPRPCQEDLMSGCDTSTLKGVLNANSKSNPQVHTVDTGPYEVIQFNSGFQITSWKHWMAAEKYAVVHQTHQVPWEEIEDLHGATFLRKIQNFYAV